MWFLRNKAVENYDGRSKFIFYASNYIRHELYRGLTTVHYGSYANHRIASLNSKANRLRYYLKDKLERNPTDKEIASELGVKLQTYIIAQNVANLQFISAETTIKNLDTSTKFNEQHLYMEKLLWKINLLHIINQLSVSEKRVLIFRYGLFDDIIRTIDKTSILMGMSNESTRILINSALNKVRQLQNIL